MIYMFKMCMPFYSKEYFLNGFLVYNKNVPVVLSRSDLDFKACMLLPPLGLNFQPSSFWV